ncbi:hypothetical protein ACFY3U_00745 [Micromonospora sp. NPDC000089]|uniref:hypothetical protein n=1 Tax=unclassified Micromonospora TaxID=2617518 RepID=UPI003688F30B
MLRAGALLVAGGATVPLTGCDLFDGDKPPPAPDPLEPLAGESGALAARHRAAIAADPGLADRLTPIAEAHAAHAAELRRVIGRPEPSGSTTPAGTPPPAGRDAILADLRGAEQRGRDAAARACAAAPGDRAALVGSIAAARASHLEVLK